MKNKTKQKQPLLAQRPQLDPQENVTHLKHTGMVGPF